MRILVRPGPHPRRGYLYNRGRRVPCALGKNGVSRHKREGDGATPGGRFPLRILLYRHHPYTVRFPSRRIGPRDGWCDDPEHRHYNRRVQRPCAGRSEALRHRDRLYDLVVVIGYNDAPPQADQGSAIFLHSTRTCQNGSGLTPTQGCVALPRQALIWLIATLRRRAWIEIMPQKTETNQKTETAQKTP